MDRFIGKQPRDMSDTELREAQKFAIEDIAQSRARNIDDAAVAMGDCEWNMMVIRECAIVDGRLDL